MIRNDFDISDEDFEKINKPFEEAIGNYLHSTFIDEYLAYYIATGYNSLLSMKEDLVSYLMLR